MAQGYTRQYPAQNSGKTVNRFVLAQSAAGTTIIAAAVAGKKHKIIGVTLTLSELGTVKFTGTSNLTGVINLNRDAGFVIQPNPTFIWIETGVNENLSIVTTVDASAGPDLGGADGIILYLTEP